MRIQYMSDLHLEFQENSRYLKHNELPVTGDVLVLAGDIFYLKDKIAPLTKFWKWASENYRQVLIVPGNHEYYNYSDVMERGLQWRWMFRENVGYYQNQVVRIDDTDFVLSTLWSRPLHQLHFHQVLNGFHRHLGIALKGDVVGDLAYQLHVFSLVCMEHGLADGGYYFFFVEADDASVTLEYRLYHIGCIF